MTSLVGLDGRRRTAGVRAKVAEAEYLAWAHSIVDQAPSGMLERREAEHEDYLCRVEVARLRRAEGL